MGEAQYSYVIFPQDPLPHLVCSFITGILQSQVHHGVLQSPAHVELQGEVVDTLQKKNERNNSSNILSVFFYHYMSKKQKNTINCFLNKQNRALKLTTHSQEDTNNITHVLHLVPLMALRHYLCSTTAAALRDSTATTISLHTEANQTTGPQ